MRPDLLLSLRHALSLAIGAGIPIACDLPSSAGESPDDRTGDLSPGARTDAHEGDDDDNAPTEKGAAVCDPENLRPSCAELNEHYNECEFDADCQGGAFGKCVQSLGQIGSFCECDYSC